MPRRLHHRCAGAGAGERADEGSALIVTVLVAGVLAIAATATVTSGVASVGESGALAARTSARLAAESGVNATYAAMARASSAGALPCGLSAQLQPRGSGPTGYATTVAYSGASGCQSAAGSLGGTTEPSAATITATGSAPGATVVMQRATAGRANVPFPIPPGVSHVEIDRDTGKLALPTCPRTTTEAFLAGTEPATWCELHQFQ